MYINVSMVVVYYGDCFSFLCLIYVSIISVMIRMFNVSVK